MAIEDEIINITDIDVGTEILNNDKLIIETNNGTRLIAFKDLVIGEDNITFKDKLIQGAGATGGSATTFSTVTGYNILTSDTTAGHVTKYSDVSGSVELGKFNYNGIVKFAGLSATIAQNEAKISELENNLTDIYNQLQNTSSADLNAITITTKPVNFKVNSSGSGSTGTRSVGFDTIDLNPNSTNSECSFESSPFKITYPSDSSYSASWILFIGDIWTSWDQYKAGQAVTLYVDNKRVTEANLIRQQGGNLLAKIQAFQYIPKGAEVTLQFKTTNTSTYKGSTFSGIKIS